MAPRNAVRKSPGSLWRLTGALGRAWRLHSAAAPIEIQEELAKLLRMCQRVLLPHLSQDTDANQELMGLLAALAGRGQRRGGAGDGVHVQAAAHPQPTKGWPNPHAAVFIPRGRPHQCRAEGPGGQVPFVGSLLPCQADGQRRGAGGGLSVRAGLPDSERAPREGGKPPLQADGLHRGQDGSTGAVQAKGSVDHDRSSGVVLSKQCGVHENVPCPAAGSEYQRQDLIQMALELPLEEVDKLPEAVKAQLNSLMDELCEGDHQEGQAQEPQEGPTDQAPKDSKEKWAESSENTNQRPSSSTSNQRPSSFTPSSSELDSAHSQMDKCKDSPCTVSRDPPEVAGELEEGWQEVHSAFRKAIDGFEQRQVRNRRIRREP